LFAVGLISVILTALYVVRLMGLIFNAKHAEEQNMKHEKEASSLMLAPLGILTALTIAIGLGGPWVEEFLSNTFTSYFQDSLGLTAVNNALSNTGNNFLILEIFVAVVSTLMVLIGMFPAYRFFISHKSDPTTFLSGHSSLRAIHQFLWNRWYMEAFYNKVFLNTGLALKELAIKYVENPLDQLLNVEVPAFFAGVSRGLRKVQTGILSVNLLYFILLFIAILIALRGLGVL